jgi:hypothetical protein
MSGEADIAHTVDLATQSPRFRRDYNELRGDVSIVLTTDAPLYDVTVVGLNNIFLFMTNFYYVNDWVVPLGHWEAGTYLVLDSYIWNGHLPWYALTFRDALGQTRYVTIHESFVGGCVPRFNVPDIDHRLIVSAGRMLSDTNILHTVETNPPPLVTALLGPVTRGEIQTSHIPGEPLLYAEYAILHYDNRPNFYIRAEASGWGVHPTLGFASQAAREAAGSLNEVHFQWGIDAFPHNFDTQEGDAVLVRAPFLDAVWLFIDIGEPPRGWAISDNSRSYVAFFRP